jgi:DNA polymerase I-like protein with 3'-5' exonuclease and polymerase domains
LIFELPLGEIDIFASQIKQIMEGVYDLAAPLKVEIETGQNWGELTKWKS